MKHTMTEGNPLKLLIFFAMPLLLGNLLQQAYNLCDACIVGRCLGADALACVGGTSSVQFLVLGFCIGNCAGFGIPIAKYFGAGDESAMKKRIFHALILAAATAFLLMGVGTASLPIILKGLHTPQELYAGTYRYLLIIFLGIPFTFLYNMMAGILRSLGDSRTPFLFLCLSAGLNIVLDCFCIMVLHTGVGGAAAATICSQLISGLLCAVKIIRSGDIFRFAGTEKKLQPSIIKEMIGMGFPLGFQYSITAVGMMVMQSANNSLGSIYISAFTAGAKIKQFAMCPFDAFATSITVYCSQNLGAGKMERVRAGVRRGLLMVMGYGAAAGAILLLFGRVLSGVFLSAGENEILDAAYLYLKINGAFFVILGPLNVLRAAIQGLGHGFISIFSGVTEMIARSVISTCLIGGIGFAAIGTADVTAWSCAVVLLIIIYKRVLAKTSRSVDCDL